MRVLGGRSGTASLGEGSDPGLSAMHDRQNRHLRLGDTVDDTIRAFDDLANVGPTHLRYCTTGVGKGGQLRPASTACRT